VVELSTPQRAQKISDAGVKGPPDEGNAQDGASFPLPCRLRERQKAGFARKAGGAGGGGAIGYLLS
jgi:hypothetical protein